MSGSLGSYDIASQREHQSIHSRARFLAAVCDETSHPRHSLSRNQDEAVVEIEDVFRRYQQPVYAYFLRTVGNQHDAEELTQETFVRACAAVARFRGESRVSTWLFGIAHRVLLEAARHGLFDRRDPPIVEPPSELPDQDARLDLEAAFQALEPADREVLMLVDFLGFEPAEAASLLGVEPGATRMRLLRARRRLRARLEGP